MSLQFDPTQNGDKIRKLNILYKSQLPGAKSREEFRNSKSPWLVSHRILSGFYWIVELIRIWFINNSWNELLRCYGKIARFSYHSLFGAIECVSLFIFISSSILERRETMSLCHLFCLFGYSRLFPFEKRKKEEQQKPKTETTMIPYELKHFVYVSSSMHLNEINFIAR